MSAACEPAGVCQYCRIAGDAGERWRNSDTCDTCAFWAAGAQWGTTAAERESCRQSLRRRCLTGAKEVAL